MGGVFDGVSVRVGEGLVEGGWPMWLACLYKSRFKALKISLNFYAGDGFANCTTHIHDLDAQQGYHRA